MACSIIKQRALKYSLIGCCAFSGIILFLLLRFVYIPDLEMRRINGDLKFGASLFYITLADVKDILNREFAKEIPIPADSRPVIKAWVSYLEMSSAPPYPTVKSFKQ